MKQLAKAYAANAIGDSRFDLLKRWTYTLMHCYEAKEFLRLADETHTVYTKSSLDEVLTQQALFRSFLISYAKCFGGNGAGRTTIDPGRLFPRETTQLEVHNRIISLRNRFAAHNDDSGLDDVVIDIEESDTEIVFAHYYGLANPLNEYPAYRENVSSLEAFIVDKLNTVADRIGAQSGKPLVMRGG